MKTSFLRKHAAYTAFLLVACRLLAGPVVIDGTDANDHGSSTGGVNVDGWIYMQKVLENQAAAVGAGAVKVVTDLGTAPASQARNAIDSAFSLSTLPGLGWTIQHVDAVDIDSFMSTLSVANTGILYIPTAGNSAGDLSDVSLTTLNTHGLSINNFVNAGGGLFAMGESPLAGATPYGWLISLLPAVTVVDVGGGGISSTITLTAAGMTAFPGLTSTDLSAGPWHNYFTGTFGGLQVLATADDGTGIQRALIIGGGAGTSIVPPPPAKTCTPVSSAPYHFGCITREARFWFSHPETNDPSCATLKAAIDLLGGEICIGFQTLPVEYENSDNVKDGEDALIEALGLYWRNQKRTGEDQGRQTLRSPASALCRARKQLSVELIASLANNVLLGTSPTNCFFFDGVSTTNFPADLIEQAGDAAKGEDLTAVRTLTALLHKFNASGLTNDFANGLIECSAWKRSTLRKLSRDPTTRFSCGGFNDDLFTATALTSFPYQKTVDLSRYANDLTDPTCGVGGAEAVWKIAPPVAAAGRNFVIDTEGSNFDTLLSIWQQTSSGGGAVTIQCNDDANSTTQSQLTFTADGTSTYFIVAEGKQGATGQLKIRVRSF